MNEVTASLRLFWPEVALTAGLLLVVLVDSFAGAARNTLNRALTALTLLAAIGLLLRQPAEPASLWSGMLASDPMATFFKLLLAAAALLLVLSFTFRNSSELHGLGQGEFYALLLALTLSNMLMATATDLVMLYLALEMVSIGSYVMVAYLKGDRESNEASLKYLLFGAVSTGAMLYGLSLLYGFAGTTSLEGVRTALAAGTSDAGRLSLHLAALLVLAGFGFKTAAVPFHFWCPDAYQGAPTPVTAFLSVAPKAAGFAVLLRFVVGGFGQPGGGPWETSDAVSWAPLLMLVSIVTMTWGNVAALTQTNMKRLLAYSSIAHAGYLMMGVVALSDNGARGLLVYLLAYLVMNLGAFLVVLLVHHHEGSFDLRDWAGLHRRAPFLTGAMAVFLLSLMGIPPLVGFMGKLYVFAAVIEKGSPESMGMWWFAAVGAVNAAVAAYYYMRVLKTMMIDPEPEPKPAISLAFADRAWLAALLLANVLPLLFWTRIEQWAQASLTLYASR